MTEKNKEENDQEMPGSNHKSYCAQLVTQCHKIKEIRKMIFGI